jgi:tight adherence protein B
MWSWFPLPKTLKPPSNPSEAQIIRRLAVFLQAGLSPASAWRELAGHSDSVVPSQVVQSLGVAQSINRAVAEVTTEASEGWRALGACWSIARQTGAPVAPALVVLSHALLDIQKTRREIQVALASPLATIRLVLVLPVVAVLGSLLSGVGEAHTVFLSPLGLGLMGLGGVMIAVAWWWSHRLAESAKPAEGSLSLELDLFAVACSGGSLPEAAHRLVSRTLADYDLLASDDNEVAALTELSRRAGVPVVNLATAHAQLWRERVRSEAQERVERLGVLLVVPLGLLVLPAFVLIAVVPMAIALWGDNLSTS